MVTEGQNAGLVSIRLMLAPLLFVMVSGLTGCGAGTWQRAAVCFRTAEGHLMKADSLLRQQHSSERKNLNVEVTRWLARTYQRRSVCGVYRLV